ncbi:MAG TPA: RNA polymerase sigma-70 factor [Pedobacter sp.]|uniref:RNA polymerase sigma-70 factor n=1 Tax=Pedobacter sp. TaxID=1411316 RepID=UPI002B616892|nr:RNA polymerase sigma-70 factor [Pedobacter sp.]HMI03510.1 RNA polymerase sigma-70 factor [Pedobacter sp.]
MEYLLLTDKELLEYCANDDLKAFNILFDRYSGKIYRYALSYVQDECFAEEAMMDLMFWIWDKRHTLKIQGEVHSYIFRAAKNATIKAIRKKAIALTPIEAIENSITHTSAPADGQLNARELEIKYHMHLDRLSPQRKKVFQMSRENDLSHAEIAADLNISINTVKNHIKSALSHFREQFEDYTKTALPAIIGLFILFH